MTDTPRLDTDEPRRADAPGLDLLAGALLRARRALAWERVWPGIVRVAGAVGLFLAASWAGLWLVLPPVARGPVLFAFLALLAWAAIPLVRFRRPRLPDALRRLDRAAGGDHRPATALADRLATKPDDPVSRALWQAHRDRMVEAASGLRAGLPSPRLVEHDPRALRALVLLLVIGTWFGAAGERERRILAAFDWSGAVAAPAFRVDAWVTPPAYTGRPPILLSGVRSGEPVRPTGRPGPIEAPAGSVVTVRATGLAAMDLQVRGGLADAPADGAPAAPAGTLERRLVLSGDGDLALRGVGDADLAWPFTAVPDKAPTIAFARDANTVGRGALSFAYRLEDDYGVVSAEARFARKGAPAGGARPLFTLDNAPLQLPQARTRSGSGETVKDLTEHPWAGATVTVTLAARDDAGNEGTSEPADVVLPQRAFTKPVARALVEQRRLLAMDANMRGKVERALEGLLLAPERFTPETGVFLGLSTAYWRLAGARSDDDLREVVAYLWDIAVLIEDGSMADAERELRAAEDALRQALDRNASDEEIKQLADKLRQALDRFMRELAEELRKNPDRAQSQRPLDRNARVLRPQDLKNMIDRLENLARSGARDAARRMLDELQAMLDSLDRNRSGEMAEGDGDQEMDELGDMIRNQQQLRDRTWREGREQRERQRQQGRQGNRQQPGQGQNQQLSDLQQQQEGLRQQLERLLDQLRQRRERGEGAPGQEGQDGESPGGQAFGRARDAMRDAERQLGEGNADGAVDSQGRALEQLRRGAQAMAQNQPGQGGPGNPDGPAANTDMDTDPLGRPRASNREIDTSSRDRVPDAIDAQRARRVLEELRKRLGEMERPRLELDYLERLLRDF